LNLWEIIDLLRNILGMVVKLSGGAGRAMIFFQIRYLGAIRLAAQTPPAEEIDPQRLRTDPAYRREVRQDLARRSEVERTANRGPQPPEIEQERQR
jgi:hypothetical protein